MLTFPLDGINVFSNPPPSADGPDYPKNNRQLIYITLNDQILSQILSSGGKGLSVTFGPNAVIPPDLLFFFLSACFTFDHPGSYSLLCCAIEYSCIVTQLLISCTGSPSRRRCSQILRCCPRSSICSIRNISSEKLIFKSETRFTGQGDT